MELKTDIHKIMKKRSATLYLLFRIKFFEQFKAYMSGSLYFKRLRIAIVVDRSDRPGRQITEIDGGDEIVQFNPP